MGVGGVQLLQVIRVDTRALGNSDVLLILLVQLSFILVHISVLSRSLQLLSGCVTLSVSSEDKVLVASAVRELAV